jgi:hypothetical protein
MSPPPARGGNAAKLALQIRLLPEEVARLDDLIMRWAQTTYGIPVSRAQAALHAMLAGLDVLLPSSGTGFQSPAPVSILGARRARVLAAVPPFGASPLGVASIARQCGLTPVEVQNDLRFWLSQHQVERTGDGYTRRE